MPGADAARAVVAQALGLAALSAVFFAAPKAHAGLTEDLLARTSANKVRRLFTPARMRVVASDQRTGGCWPGTGQPARNLDAAALHMPAYAWLCGVDADAHPPQALNDSKRLATSGANFARSRTVTDGTCAFPNNVRTPLFVSGNLPTDVLDSRRCAAQMVGCENAAESGSVKYLSDDLKLECQGTEAGKVRRSLPSRIVSHPSLTHLPLAVQICAARNPSSFPSFMGV